MSAGNCNLDRLAKTLLPLHVCEVVAMPFIGRDERSEVGRVRFNLQLTAKVLNRLDKGSHWNNVDARDDARLLGVLLWNEHRTATDAPHLDDDGDDSSYASHAARE